MEPAYNPEEDLFENWANIPEKVNDILCDYEEFECLTIKQFEELNERLNEVGFNCELGADFVPMMLQRIP